MRKKVYVTNKDTKTTHRAELWIKDEFGIRTTYAISTEDPNDSELFFKAAFHPELLSDEEKSRLNIEPIATIDADTIICDSCNNPIFIGNIEYCLVVLNRAYCRRCAFEYYIFPDKETADLIGGNDEAI